MTHINSYGTLTNHLISARRPDLIITNKKKKKKKEKKKEKKENLKNCRLSCPGRITQKECEKKDKYCDLARELKKLWNMKVTIIPIVIGTFGTVIKGLLKGLEDLEVGGRVVIIQTTALLRMARILRRVLETWRDLLSLNNFHYFYSLKCFSHQRQLMVFHWSLKDSKSPQISRTLVSIMADINNAVVWMCSIHPVISNSFSPSTNPFQVLEAF